MLAESEQVLDPFTLRTEARPAVKALTGAASWPNHESAVHKLHAGSNLGDTGSVFEQAAYCLVGEIDAQRCSGGRDRYPVDGDIDLDSSASGHVIAEILIYSFVGCLRPAWCSVLLEPPSEIVGLTHIVPGAAVAT